MTAKSAITKEITIEELLSRFPQKAQKLAQVLSKEGLQCVGCSAATWETLESGILRHGKGEIELVRLLENLNRVLEEESPVDTITVTKKAADKFKEIAKAEGKGDCALRFDEVPAGCSGFEYVLDFSESPSDADTIFTSNGVNIHVVTSSIPRLLGCEIDYVDGLQSGFKISNPNVRSSCGCGSSHGY